MREGDQGCFMEIYAVLRTDKRVCAWATQELRLATRGRAEVRCFRELRCELRGLESWSLRGLRRGAEIRLELVRLGSALQPGHFEPENVFL